jgi:hypothetical protein
MPQQISLLEVVEVLAMLTATFVAYCWVCTRIVGWPPTPIDPGSKDILRLATPRDIAMEDSKVRSSQQAA